MSLIILSGLLLGLFLCLYQRLKDWYRWSWSASNKYAREGAIAVVVLGDMGCSPRMCNHVVQIAKAVEVGDLPNVKKVHFIGYHLSGLPRSLQSHQCVTIHALPQVTTNITRHQEYRIVRVLLPLFKMLYNVANVWLTLSRIDQLQTVLMQNPPSHATAPVVSCLCWMRSASFIIDCHNYGWTIAAMNPAHTRLIPILRALEIFGLQRAHALFSVSANMQKDLLNFVKTKVVTLYDKPPDHFQEPVESMQDAMLERYLGVTNKDDRGFIIATSTSYTLDEDMKPLIEALRLFANQPYSPDRIRLLVTGRGDLHKDLAILVKSTQALDQAFADKVTLHQVFASVEDYPMLIGSADVGVCLHTSSSNLDLPMKVVDMIGVRLPFIAYKYPTISELMQDAGEAGATFSNANELAKVLCHVSSDDVLPRMKEAARKRTIITWQEEWKAKALPVVKVWSNGATSAKDKLQ